MPGIADAPITPLQLGAGSAAQINENVVSPDLNNFMKSFRDGFITTEDITKRALDKPLENAQRQQALADTNIVRPKQREVAAKGLDLQSQSLDAQTQSQPLLDEASILEAEEKLAAARRGNDKNTLLKGYQTVVNPGGLPPYLIPGDPKSGYDYAKMEQDGVKYFDALRAQLRASEAAKNIKSFTSKTTDSSGRTTESVSQFDELTGKLVRKPVVIGESSPQADVPRKEYNNLAEVTDFRKVDAAFNKLNTALDDTKNATALGDQGAIFSWMKILDPSSTVREGEYATVEKTRSWADNVRALYNRAQSGLILTPEQRKQMKDAATPLHEGQFKSLIPQLDRYIAMEEKLNLPGEIVPEGDADLLRKIRAKEPQSAAVAPAVVDSLPRYNSVAEVPPDVLVWRMPNGKKYERDPSYRPPAQ